MKTGSLKYLFYILFLVLLQEVVFRCCFPLPELSNFDRINYMLLPEQPGKIRHQRNQNWHWQSSPDTPTVFIHEMNLYGFRDREWPIKKKHNVPRMMFVGDSFTEGIMASQDETICAAFLDEEGRGSLEVFNAGMMGTGINSYLKFLADAIPIFLPDYIFLCISSNDLGGEEPRLPDGFFVPQYFSCSRPRLIEVIRQLRGQSPLKFRWDNRSKSYIPNQHNKSSPWYVNAEDLGKQVAPHLGQAMKLGKMSPFRVNNLYNESITLLSDPQLGEMLPFFKSLCRKHQVIPIVVYLPSRATITDHYYQFDRQLCLEKCSDKIDLSLPSYRKHSKIMERECESLQVTFIDPYQRIKNAEQTGQRLYWNYDDHMKTQGYRLVGQYIYEQWQQLLSLRPT